MHLGGVVGCNLRLALKALNISFRPRIKTPIVSVSVFPNGGLDGVSKSGAASVKKHRLQTE